MKKQRLINNWLKLFSNILKKRSDLRRINTWEKEFSTKEKDKLLCMKRLTKRTTIVMQKLEITSLSKPRLSVIHLKRTLRSTLPNLVLISKVKQQRKLVIKFQRLWLKDTKNNILKSNKNLKTIFQTPKIKRNMEQPQKKKNNFWLKCKVKKTKNKLLRINFSLKLVKMLKISS